MKTSEMMDEWDLRGNENFMTKFNRQLEELDSELGGPVSNFFPTGAECWPDEITGWYGLRDSSTISVRVRTARQAEEDLRPAVRQLSQAFSKLWTTDAEILLSIVGHGSLLVCGTIDQQFLEAVDRN